MFKYSVEWHDDAQNAAPEERAAVADLRLFIEQQNVTLHLRGNESVDHITISPYSVAEGLIHDWWKLFGGRDQAISFIRYRNGYVVPDVRLSFDGAVFTVSAHQCTYTNPDVRFWAGPTAIANKATAEQALDGFIYEVLNRLDSKNVHNTSATLRWARVRTSRDNPEELAFCEAAGALGLDPYEISAQDAHKIEQAASLFEGEALSEFLSGAKNANQYEITDWIDEVEKRSPYTSRVGNLRDIAKRCVEIAPAREFEESWALGYRRAQAMRRALNIESTARFRSFKTLAEKLGASRNYTLAPRINGLRALRTDKDNSIYIHMRMHGENGSQAAHLFSFTRAVGDATCFPKPGRAPINELHSAYRQAAGRAFAAEFLAPIDEIRSMSADGHDSVSMAEEFGVSIPVVERQLENQERIAAAVTS